MNERMQVARPGLEQEHARAGGAQAIGQHAAGGPRDDVVVGPAGHTATAYRRVTPG